MFSALKGEEGVASSQSRNQPSDKKGGGVEVVQPLEVAQHCIGHPLAIKMMSSWLRGLDLTES